MKKIIISLMLVGILLVPATTIKAQELALSAEIIQKAQTDPALRAVVIEYLTALIQLLRLQLVQLAESQGQPVPPMEPTSIQATPTPQTTPAPSPTPSPTPTPTPTPTPPASIGATSVERVDIIMTKTDALHLNARVRLTPGGSVTLNSVSVLCSVDCPTTLMIYDKGRPWKDNGYVGFSMASLPMTFNIQGTDGRIGDNVTFQFSFIDGATGRILEPSSIIIQ